MMLRDAEIVALIGEHPNLIEGLQYEPADPLRDPTAIQAASVDLTIGDIFLPETGSSEDGGVTGHLLGTTSELATPPS